MKTLLEMAILVMLNIFLFGFIQRKLVFRATAMQQQLSVCMRKIKRPPVKERDRIFWMLISKIWPEWASNLFIVKPETVLSWNRRRLKDYWRKISKPKGKVGRPPISQKHIDYI